MRSEHLAERGSDHGVFAYGCIRAYGVATTLVRKAAQRSFRGHGGEVAQPGTPQAGGSDPGHSALFICRTGARRPGPPGRLRRQYSACRRR